MTDQSRTTRHPGRADMPGDWSDIPAPMTREDMKRPIPPPPADPETTTQKSGLTAEQHEVLWRPWEPGAASPADLRQLVRLALLEKVSGCYFVTAEGKKVREMPHG